MSIFENLRCRAGGSGGHHTSSQSVDSTNSDVTTTCSVCSAPFTPFLSRLSKHQKKVFVEFVALLGLETPSYMSCVLAFKQWHQNGGVDSSKLKKTPRSEGRALVFGVGV